MVLFFENPNFKDWNYLHYYNLKSLQIDHALLNLTSIDHKIWMYTLESECNSCPFEKLRHVNTNASEYIQFSTVYSQIWKFYDKDQGKYAYLNNVS